MKHFIQSNIGMGFLGMGYHFGSSHEELGLRGCTHLMEHLQCKPIDLMLPELTRLGVDYNAYTDDDRVVFHFSGLDEELQSVADAVCRKIRLADPFWSEEEFNNEKQTVLQEYGDSFNSQESGTYYNLLRKHYGYAGAIGYRKDIENFTYQDSINFSRKFITPHQVVLVGKHDIALDIPVSDAEDNTVRRPFKYVEESGMEQENVPKEDKSIIGLIGMDVLNFSTREELAKLQFVMSCLNDGLESPLNQEIREKRGLSYYSSDMLELLGTTAVPVFMASTSNERSQELIDVYCDFFDGKVGRWITRERFMDMQSAYALSEKKRNILPFQGAGPRLFKPFSNEGISNLSYEEVLEAAQLLSVGKMSWYKY